MRKRKREKRYWSIMLVPHSTNEIKVFKISSVKYKLLGLVTIIATAIICTSLTITSLIRENKYLSEKIALADELTEQQALLIEENEIEINELKQERIKQSKITEEFKTLYKELTHKYIEENMNDIVATRSTGRDDREFVESASKLKSILEELEKINYSDAEITTDLEDTQEKLTEYMNVVPTLWPTNGSISSGFGYRMDPISFTRKFHYGIDISAPYGREIKASASGKVILSDWHGNYGKTVIVDHGRGITTLYAHCSSLLVSEGETVNKGDVIAQIGSTGRSTGNHLHFEVRVFDTAVDPMEYLDPR
ncbi:MAG: M23 family metallopeptidase [Clostridium sp.]|jgi:murein DD-endopeptidase MepM/ murein hydrolase activator NlpD|nr:M23 family metallopeptidase [Clostridium sp.]